MYYFTFVNFKQFGLLLEAIHLRSFCGEFLISGDDNLRSFLPVSYRSLELLGSESLGTWLEDSRLAASPKVSICQRSFCSEPLYLGPRSEILVINFSLSGVIFGAMAKSSSFSNIFQDIAFVNHRVGSVFLPSLLQRASCASGKQLRRHSRPQSSGSCWAGTFLQRCELRSKLVFKFKLSKQLFAIPLLLGSSPGSEVDRGHLLCAGNLLTSNIIFSEKVSRRNYNIGIRTVRSLCSSYGTFNKSASLYQPSADLISYVCNNVPYQDQKPYFPLKGF